MAPPVIMHVNYCEQGQTIEEMCEKAVRWGFDGIEFRSSRQGVDETPAQHLDTIARAVERTGLKHVLFGGPGPDLMNPDPSVREREIERMTTFYELAAQRFPLTVCNAMTGTLRNPDPAAPPREYELHGSGAATPDHWRWAAEGYQQIARVAEKLGFRLAFEIHPNYLHDTVPATMRLVREIGAPHVGVNLDYGNLVYFKKPPSLKEAVEQTRSALYLVHLKNSIGLHGGQRFPVGLGDGDINHREFLALLKASGYDGPICIEAPRPGDREHFAVQDLAYIRSVLEALGW